MKKVICLMVALLLFISIPTTAYATSKAIIPPQYWIPAIATVIGGVAVAPATLIGLGIAAGLLGIVAISNVMTKDLYEGMYSDLQVYHPEVLSQFEAVDGKIILTAEMINAINEYKSRITTKSVSTLADWNQKRDVYTGTDYASNALLNSLDTTISWKNQFQITPETANRITQIITSGKVAKYVNVLSCLAYGGWPSYPASNMVASGIMLGTEVAPLIQKNSSLILTDDYAVKSISNIIYFRLVGAVIQKSTNGTSWTALTVGMPLSVLAMRIFQQTSSAIEVKTVTSNDSICVETTLAKAVDYDFTAPMTGLTGRSLDLGNYLGKGIPIINPWDVVSGGANPYTGTVDGEGTLTVNPPIATAIPTAVPITQAVPTTAELTDGATDIIGKVIDDIIPERMEQTWDVIDNIDTTRGQPPKIMINLSSIFNAATDRFGNPASPFGSGETVFFDFAMMNDFKFMNTPLIDWFRSMIGFGFLLTTGMYIWRKLTPKEVI